MPNCISTPFAQPRIDTRNASLAGRISGKLTRFLARNVRTKTAAMRNARPLVTFTFDDVAASACSVGAPMLERYDVRGTFYISGGGCGAASPGGRLATTDQMKALHAKGHELGCHTYSHAAVASIGSGELARELDQNRSFLRSIASATVGRNFAYPYGDFSFRSKRYLESRFDSCRSLIWGVNTGIIDLGALKTWALENASLDRGRIVELIAETARTKGWLIFSSHDVGDEPSRFGVSPDLLEFALTAAREAGCAPVTVAEGLKCVTGVPQRGPDAHDLRTTERNDGFR